MSGLERFIGRFAEGLFIGIVLLFMVGGAFGVAIFTLALARALWGML